MIFVQLNKLVQHNAYIKVWVNLLTVKTLTRQENNTTQLVFDGPDYRQDIGYSIYVSETPEEILSSPTMIKIEWGLPK